LIGVDQPFERVELLDDYRLRYTFDTPIREEVAMRRTLSTLHNTPAWFYGEYLDRLEAATNAAERDAVRGELQDRSVTLEEAAEAGIGCGPYELSEVSVNRLMLDTFDEHPGADEVAVPRAWFPSVQELRAEELTEEGVLDIGQGVLDRFGESVVAPNVEQLETHATQFTTTLLLNHFGDPVDDRNVRRAILAALPLDLLNRTGEWGSPTAVQTGLADPVARRWLDEDLRDALARYPVERDDERAGEFMRRAGYERQGDRWVGSDGEPPRLAIDGPTWENWSLVADQVRRSLRDFGFAVEVNTYPQASFFGNVVPDNFEAVLWRSRGSTFDAFDVTTTRLGSLGMGVTDADRDRGERGRPVEQTIPSDPGALSVSGSGETLDLLALHRELREPISTERTREILGLLARWWNYDLPNLTLATTTTGIWGNTRDYDWPDAGAVYRTSGPAHRVDYHLLKTGAVRPAESATDTDDE
jgi:ABC-type transport system substrate-binding protein